MYLQLRKTELYKSSFVSIVFAYHISPLDLYDPLFTTTKNKYESKYKEMRRYLLVIA